MEQNYPIYDRELLGMMRGLQTWRHLLRNTTHPVLVITDHANLQYYQEPQKLGPRVNGYLAELAEYHIQLVYKPGAAQRVDGLSRRPDLIPDDDDELIIVLPDHLFVSPDAPKTTYLATRTKAENYDSDDTLVDLEDEDAQLKARATTEDLPSGFALDQMVYEAQKMEDRTIRQWRIAHMLLKSGNLWTKESAFVVVGNNALKRGVISLFHDSTTAGHPGITKTLALMKPYYWWPNMKNFITEYIKGCATCQMTKVNTQPTRPPLFPIYSKVNALPFQTISLDFIVKLPISDGYDTILTITDHDCSKAAIFIPCNEEIDATGVAKVYANYVFPHYGLPKKVISDRDPRFASNFSRELCDLLRIKQNISSAYHPQTDGQSERTNQSLEQYLRLYCGSQQKEWAFWLPLAQYTRNSWPNTSTKKSPFELILGYVPLAHQPSREANIPDINNRLARIKEAREEAQHALKQVQEKMIKETRFKGFEIGNKVWLEGTNIKRPYDSRKLSPKRYGPFEVVAKMSHVAYQISLPETWGIHDVFHASLLTPYKETDEHGTNFLEPPPELIEGEEEWEVEQILGKRHFGRGKKLQYLVRWKGYSPAHDQWVDKSDITAEELVMIYERENREERPPRRSIRTPRKKANEVIRSLRLSPTNNNYYRLMSSNADTVNTQQVSTGSDNTTTKIQGSQATFPPVTPVKDSPAIIDTAIFAGTSSTGPIQVRDGTPRLAFVPLGGTFIDADTIASLQSQPTTYLAAIKDGENNAPSPLALSPTSPRPEKSASPSPIPIPPRSQTDNRSGAYSANDSILTSADPDRDRYSPETLLALWRRVKALGKYHTEHRHYPGGFSLPGLSKTAAMIRILNDLPKAPENLADFMTEKEIRHRLDLTLVKGLQAALPQLEVFMDDSRNVLKELTHETRNVVKERRDDSRDVLKDLAPRTIEWGNNIQVVPVATGPEPQYSAPSPHVSTLPALEALVQATRVRVLLEEGDDSSNSDDINAVKMEVDSPPRTSSKSNADAPIDLTTSDDESDKENDRIHPGPTWMHYNPRNPEHYRLEIPEHNHMTSAARYIRYMFDGEETILEGCDGKQAPIYRKALHARSADTRPNLRDDKLIRDDHLHVLHPQASLKELVDRHIHAINDPGVTAEVVRFRSQTTRRATFSTRLKSLEEDIRMNDDTLLETRRRLIHARLPT